MDGGKASSVEDPEHLQTTLANSIRNQIGAVGQNPFTSTGQSTFPACCRKARKVIDAGENGLYEICCCLWILYRNVSGFFIKVLECITQPLNAHCLPTYQQSH